MTIGADTLAALLVDAHGRDSHWHGETHWRAVAQTGLGLVADDERVDPAVVLLFAVLHDSRRRNGNHDPEHGPRAAERLLDILAGPLLALDAAQAATLHTALTIHTGAHPAEVTDPTVGACLDADRLNLWRVGKAPKPGLLCTPYARRPDVIAGARALCSAAWSVGKTTAATDLRILSWTDLADAYAELIPATIPALLSGLPSPAAPVLVPWSLSAAPGRHAARERSTSRRRGGPSA